MKNQASLHQPFQELINEYQRLIYKIARAYAAESQLDDLYQEICAHLWRAFPKYDRERARTSWVYRIALNVSISYYRKEQSRKKKHAALSENLSLINTEPEQSLDTKVKALYAFLNHLSEIDRALMILYLEDKSHEEIGQILGISKSNVATKVNRIKNRLKTHFQTDQH